ncbi:MAG: dockerin type I repeat-containing protein [Planctomycetota bacterium]
MQRFPNCSLAFIACFLLLVGNPIGAQNTLRIGCRDVLPDTIATLPVLATNDQPIHALSIALRHSPTLHFDSGVSGLDFAGSIIEAVLAGSSPGFLSLEYDAVVDELTLGLLLEVVPLPVPLELPVASNEQLLLSIGFEIPVTTAPGMHTVELVNGLGRPPIDNTFSSQGITLSPTLTAGGFSVTNPNDFEVVDQTVPTFASFGVAVVATHDALIQGFQVSLTYDAAELDFDSVTGVATEAGDYLFDVNPALSAGGEPYALFEVNGPTPIPGTTRSRVQVGAIIDIFSAHPLPTGSRSIVHLLFRALPGAFPGAATEIRLDPIDNFVVIEGQAVEPLLAHGLLTFSSTIAIFSRGDANLDGHIDVTDVVFVSKYALSPGVPLPCADAVDANDDGIVDTADALHLVSFLFVGGPRPAAPSPTCGVDPTTDGLSCPGYSQLCP